MLKLLFDISTCFSIPFSGSNRVLFPWYFHRGNEPENSGTGVCPPSRKLPEKHVEHHGFRRSRHWVGYLCLFLVINI